VRIKQKIEYEMGIGDLKYQLMIEINDFMKDFNSIDKDNLELRKEILTKIKENEDLIEFIEKKQSQASGVVT